MCTRIELTRLIRNDNSYKEYLIKLAICFYVSCVRSIVSFKLETLGEGEYYLLLPLTFIVNLLLLFTLQLRYLLYSSMCSCPNV